MVTRPPVQWHRPKWASPSTGAGRVQPMFVVDSILDITPAMLQQAGINTVFIDINDTILPRGIKSVRAEYRQYLRKLKQTPNLKILLISNQPAKHLPNSVVTLAKQLKVDIIGGAGKPKLGKLKELDILANPPQAQKILMIGDNHEDALMSLADAEHKIHFAMVKPLLGIYERQHRRGRRYVLQRVCRNLTISASRFARRLHSQKQ